MKGYTATKIALVQSVMVLNYHYLSLKGYDIPKKGYKMFVGELYNRKCIILNDSIKNYSFSQVCPFIKALDKTRQQHYTGEIDIRKCSYHFRNFYDIYLK